MLLNLLLESILRKVKVASLISFRKMDIFETYTDDDIFDPNKQEIKEITIQSIATVKIMGFKNFEINDEK